ncbi:MAG: hypothetical protein FWH29_06040 [Methanobrevibacter sp.]|nr:hypothetical protein [Methanobrevibacter sp.]
MNSNTRFNPTDALIISQALADENSKYIFTLDRIITTTLIDGPLANLSKKLCDEGKRLNRLEAFINYSVN